MAGPSEQFQQALKHHQAGQLLQAETIYRQILQKTSFTRNDVPTLRHCMSAGEHLSDEVFALWKERFGLDVFEAVGMSEFSIAVRRMGRIRSD